MERNYSKVLCEALLGSGLLEADQVIVAGISGGPDSLTLLHLLNGVRKMLPITVIPVHVNHLLRENAAEEQKHLETIVSGMGLELSAVEIDIREYAKEMSFSIEEAGRDARYYVFTQIARELEKQGVERGRIRIATAHHADDQSETVLQHILRGSGLKGLSGMQPARLDESGYVIIRPLLRVPRTDIEAYIRENNLVPNLDESNEEMTYQRNRIRLDLIPKIEQEYNPNFRKGLRNLAEIAAVDDDYMDQVAGVVLERASSVDTVRSALVLDTEVLGGQHPAILRRVIAMALRSAGLMEEIHYSLIQEVIRVLYSEKPSAGMKLPGGLLAMREYRKLLFYRESEEEIAEDPASGYRLIVQVRKKKDFSKPENRPYAAFDYERFGREHPGMAGKIVLRTRQEGDFIAIGGGHHQKLQDYMVDAKIPKQLRNQLVLAAIGSEVLWILPHNALPTAEQREKGKFSQNYQITNRTKQILSLEITGRL